MPPEHYFKIKSFVNIFSWIFKFTSMLFTFSWERETKQWYGWGKGKIERFLSMLLLTFHAYFSFSMKINIFFFMEVRTSSFCSSFSAKNISNECGWILFNLFLHSSHSLIANQTRVWRWEAEGRLKVNNKHKAPLKLTNFDAKYSRLLCIYNFYINFYFVYSSSTEMERKRKENLKLILSDDYKTLSVRIDIIIVYERIAKYLCKCFC